jgi:hypothetical protein
MMPVDAYRCYLSLKNHFTKDSYDYHKYCGKSRATVQSFYKRKDRFWFERVARQKSDQEVVEFFLSNFISCTDPSKLWIGEIMKEGDERYANWKKRNQSLSYVFKEETQKLFENRKLEEVFDCTKGHPPVLKNFLNGNISLETLVIYDRIFLFGKKFDKKLQDPVWETVSMRMKKYSSFLNIDVQRYKSILKEVILGVK